jgi:hypothetical protein
MAIYWFAESRTLWIQCKWSAERSNSVQTVTVFVYLDKSRCDEEIRDLPEKISQKYLVSHHLGEGGFGEVSLIFEKVKYIAKMSSNLKEI